MQAIIFLKYKLKYNIPQETKNQRKKKKIASEYHFKIYNNI